MTDDPCRKCDDTGWQPNLIRGGYVWCDCAKGERFRTAHFGRRSEDGRWTKVGGTSKRASASSASDGKPMRLVRGASASSAGPVDRPDETPSDDWGDA
jgi:hypothetical protein